MEIKRSYRIINTVTQAETWVTGTDNVALHAFLSTQTDACYVELVSEQIHGSYYPVSVIQNLQIPIPTSHFEISEDTARQWYKKI